VDRLYIEKCVPELKEKLEGRRVNLTLGSPKALSLKIGALFLNVHLATPNALFLSQEPLATATAPGFKTLEACYLKAVELPSPDRLLRLTFTKVSLTGKTQNYTLLLELTGRNANAVLVSGGLVQALLRRFKSRVRQLEVGKPYIPPPLSGESLESFRPGSALPETVKEHLHRLVAELSPLNALEVSHLAEELGDLESALKEFVRRHSRSTAPVLYFDEGKPKYMTTFPYESLSGLEKVEFQGETPFLDCWMFYFKTLKGNAELKKAKEQATALITKKESALTARLKNLAMPEELMSQAERELITGELLKCNIHRVKPGMKQIAVTDYLTNKKVLIPLNPALSPAENLSQYFRRYRKLLKRAEHARKSRSELIKELNRLAELKSQVATATSVEEVKAALGELTGENRPGRKEKDSKSYHRFTLPSGGTLLVGRSAKGNDAVLRLAGGEDLWFHAKGVPGPHAVLKARAPTEEDILLSASAVVHFSNLKGSGAVPVDFTKVKHVRRRPGAPAGFVTYTGHKTIVVSSAHFERFLKDLPAKG